jgi:hypothetical protein
MIQPFAEDYPASFPSKYIAFDITYLGIWGKASLDIAYLSERYGALSCQQLNFFACRWVTKRRSGATNAG